jgi:hypothetical protein
MKRYICTISFLSVIYIAPLLYSSCQKIDNIDTPTNFAEVFETFWNQMNTNYMYWDIDSTNWNEIYYTYKPLFTKLNLNNDNDVKKSVQYFREITKKLIDGHYYISFSKASIIDSSVYPALDRKKQNSEFHYPYSYLKIAISYLDPNYNLGYDNNNISNGQPLTTLCGIINNRVLYFSCNRFSLVESYNSKTAYSVQVTLKYFFDKLDNLPENIKGIVIDVRGNPGGDLRDLNFLVGRFIDKPLHFGYTQYKSDNGRLDYTPWVEAFINPESNAKAVTVPVVVLADNYSASLSEAVVMAIHCLPKGIFVGESTWGATGPIISADVYNAGQFTIPNFLSVKTSSCRFKYINGKIYEGIGFPPDISVPFNLSSLINGKDLQLEKAISVIPQ